MALTGTGLPFPKRIDPLAIICPFFIELEAEDEQYSAGVSGVKMTPSLASFSHLISRSVIPKARLST